MTLDSYGVPDTVFGPHPEPFYEAVGRFVCMGALLEDRLRVLLQTLRQESQTAYRRLPARELVSELRGAVEDCDPESAIYTTYLDESERLITFRNHVVHNLWPAQGNGVLFGHRLARTPAEDGGDWIKFTTTQAELEENIRALVKLVSDWQPLFSHANALPRAWR